MVKGVFLSLCEGVGVVDHEMHTFLTEWNAQMGGVGDLVRVKSPYVMLTAVGHQRVRPLMGKKLKSTKYTPIHEILKYSWGCLREREREGQKIDRSVVGFWH